MKGTANRIAVLIISICSLPNAVDAINPSWRTISQRSTRSGIQTASFARFVFILSLRHVPRNIYFREVGLERSLFHNARLSMINDIRTIVQSRRLNYLPNNNKSFRSHRTVKIRLKGNRSMLWKGSRYARNASVSMKMNSRWWTWCSPKRMPLPPHIFFTAMLVGWYYKIYPTHLHKTQML